MTFSISPYKYILPIFTLLFIVVSATTQCHAGQDAATLAAENGQLVLQISLPKPPPVNLIAQLKLPANARIVSASPKAAKIDTKKSVVKWLVKNPKSGSLQFKVKTSPPTAPASASAIITYRNPGDGSLVKIEAVKK